MSTRRRVVLFLMVATTVGLLAHATAAMAASAYPTNTCVSSKLKAASKKCDALLKAWSVWDKNQDSPTRDMKLGLAATKFGDAWSKAEVKSTSKGADCTETTLSSTDMETLIDNAVNDIVTEVNDGLTLPSTCGGNLIKAAAKKCKLFLKAESNYIKKLAVDPQGTARDEVQSTATANFSSQWNSFVTGCPTTATEAAIENKVDQLSADVVFNSTTSPGQSQNWEMISFPNTTTQIEYQGVTLQPICSRGTPYAYFVKRGTNNKLLVYYQGGGACWDSTTCAPEAGAFDDDVNMTCVGGSNAGGACSTNSACPGGVCSTDNPANFTAGFGDLNNPDNPFKDWNAVFISYCTGDIHWGDKKTTYPPGPFGPQSINHRGYENAKVVEKWAREHFVNPDEVFVTGSSAGAYGAIFHGVLLQDVYPASQINVVGDAGNGVVTPTFEQNQLQPAWDIQKNFPTFLPGLDPVATNNTLADLYIAAGNFYDARGSRFAQYSTAWDGGGGSQTFFYNVMVNGILDNGSWWHSSCAWNAQMRQLAQDASAGASNYRYYIGPGSRHTVWGTNRAYTETHGGVPVLADWINDMRANTLGWTNVECTDCSLLGSCNGGANTGASCQHDSECPGGVCNLVDAKPPFTCSPASSNPGASCQRDADCPGGTCQIEASFGVCNGGSNANVKCTVASQCPGGTCDTQQPFQLDGVVSCP